jgi:hypothetical protein
LSHIESWGSWSQVSVASRKPEFLEPNEALHRRPGLIDPLKSIRFQGPLYIFWKPYCSPTIQFIVETLHIDSSA